MTDLENLQRQEYEMEVAQEKESAAIEQQILDLFQRLSPAAQEQLLDILSEDLDEEEADA